MSFLSVRVPLLLTCSILVTSSQQIITSCPIDTYARVDKYGNDILACLPCTSCPPGYGVQHQCGATENTVCTLCETGTFSNTSSKLETCAPCDRCREHQELEECTAISNTICKKDCEHGFYYDPAADTCMKCSYCFPDYPYARTVRVEDCRLQNIDNLYQCSPLPLPDNRGDSGSPPVIQSRENDVLTNRLGRQPFITRPRHRPRGSERHNGRRIRVKFPNRTTIEPTMHHVLVDTDKYIANSTPPNTANRPDASVETPLTGRESSLGDNSDEVVERISSTRQRPISTITSWVDKNSYNPGFHSTLSRISFNYHASDDVNVGQQQQYRSFTRSVIWMVVLIALACGLVSFAMTAITCHFLMRRGKNVGASVSAARSVAPTKAWVYQDLMPSTADVRPLIETPPQTRKITCV